MEADSEIARVRRQRAQAEKNVARQRKIVEGLRANHLDASIAEDLLGRFEAALQSHRAELERLTRQR